MNKINAWIAAMLVVAMPLAAQSITVVSPNGGETLTKGGEPFAIEWSVRDVTQDVKIVLLTESDERFGLIAEGLAPGGSPYRWTVGETRSGEAPAGRYKVRVVSADGAVKDASDRTFTIAAGAEPEPEPTSTTVLRVLRPNGGETLTRGQSVDLVFEIRNVPRTLYVDLFRGGTNSSNRLGTIFHIDPADIAHDATTLTLPWSAGSLPTGYAVPAAGNNCYYIRINSLGSGNSWVVDFSNAPFSLVEPAGTIEASSPLAPLTMTHSFRIAWNARNISGDLAINLLEEHGAPLSLATGVSPGLAWGHFNWVVGQLADPAATFPDVAGKRFCFQIIGNGVGGERVIEVTRWFEIVCPEITVIAPRSGAHLHRGDRTTILWSAPDLRGKVHIRAYYRRLNRTEYHNYGSQVFSSISNNGHVEWTVLPRPSGSGELSPPPTGADYRWVIRVVSERFPRISADSPEFIVED